MNLATVRQGDNVFGSVCLLVIGQLVGGCLCNRRALVDNLAISFNFNAC